jgi:hypothetical protein
MVASLEVFVKRQEMRRMNDILRAKQLVTEMEGAGIPCILYKGNRFVHDLYEKRPLRENLDIDLLVKGDQASAAIRLLVREGYSPTGFGRQGSGPETDRLLESFLDARYSYQVSLVGKNCLLDVQWGLRSAHHTFDVPIEEVFSGATKSDFYGLPTLQPNREALFWLLLTHHGGKEQWMRMRHLADLLAFMHSQGHLMDWSALVEKSADYRIKRVMLDGFWYLDRFFSFPLPAEIYPHLSGHTNRVQKQVARVWENADWGSTRFEWMSQYIRYWSQDDPRLSPSYIRDYLAYQLEKKQLDAYPKTYGLRHLIWDVFRMPYKLLKKNDSRASF